MVSVSVQCGNFFQRNGWHHVGLFAFVFLWMEILHRIYCMCMCMWEYTQEWLVCVCHGKFVWSGWFCVGCRTSHTQADQQQQHTKTNTLQSPRGKLMPCLVLDHPSSRSSACEWWVAVSRVVLYFCSDYGWTWEVPRLLVVAVHSSHTMEVTRHTNFCKP